MKKYFKNFTTALLLTVIISCSNSDDDNNDSQSINCGQALTNIDVARSAYEAEANEVTCATFKNALATYLNNCSEDPILQQELDNLPNCSSTNDN